MRIQVPALLMLVALVACGQNVQPMEEGATQRAAAAAQGSGFVGRWTGAWEGSLSPATLVVSRVTAEGEIVGSYQFAQGAPGPFSVPLRGNSFTFGRPDAQFTFALQPDGKVRATAYFGSAMRFATLSREVIATPPPVRADAIPGPTRGFCATPGVPVPAGSVVYSGAWRSASGSPGTAAPTCMAVVALPDSAASALGEGYNGYYVWGDNPWGPRNGSSRARIERRADGSAFIRFNSGSTITLDAPASNGLSSGRFEHANDPRLNGVADQVRVERL